MRASASRPPNGRRTSTPRSSASRVTRSTAAYREYLDEWAESGLDYVRGELAGEHARTAVARLLGADRADLALIASVSSAAGLVASQFGPAEPGQSVVIGEREYSSNHFPWRLLARKGYDVRQVPFRNGGQQPDDIAPLVDTGTVLVAFSGVQTATGHRSDIRAHQLARARRRRPRVRRRRATGGRVARRARPGCGRRVGHGRSQVPVERGPGARVLLPVTGGARPVHTDQCRMEGGTGPGRELLRTDDGLVADGVALRQLDQLAGRGRQRSRAVGVRRLRRRRGVPPQRRAGAVAAGIAHRDRLDAGRPARSEPQHHRLRPARRTRTGAAARVVAGAGRARLRTRRQPAPRRPLLQPRGRHRAGHGCAGQPVNVRALVDPRLPVGWTPFVSPWSDCPAAARGSAGFHDGGTRRNGLVAAGAAMAGGAGCRVS